MILGVDVSRWQQKVDWALLRSKGVEFAFIKATQGDYRVDPMLEKHLKGANDASMITGLYHWDDPNIPSLRQWEYFDIHTRGMAFNMIALDMEQDWQSWTEWSQKKITRRFDPTKLSIHSREVDAIFQHNLDKPVVIYTRQTWVQAYCKPMLTWISAGNRELWLAFYLLGGAAVKLSWEDLKSKFVPHFEKFPWGAGWPASARNLKFWQFSGDKFILPGVDTALDLNLWGGPIEELRSFCKLEPSSPIPLPGGEESLSLEQKVEILWKEHLERSQNG